MVESGRRISKQGLVSASAEDVEIYWKIITRAVIKEPLETIRESSALLETEMPVARLPVSLLQY